MPNTINVEVNWIPPATIRGNSRHFSKRGARHKATIIKEFRRRGRESGIALKELGIKPLPKAPMSLYIRVHYKDRRRRDLDNTIIGYKPFIDGLVDSGIIPDDYHIVRKITEHSSGEASNYTWLSFQTEE